MKVTQFMRNKIVEIISCLFIVLFVYASLTKLSDYQKFVTQIGQSPMLTNISGTLAWFVPAIELMIAVLLIFETTRSYALYASLSLMVMFTTYIVLASHFFDYVPCSCGGIIENFNWSQHLVFNLAFVFMAIGSLITRGTLQCVTDEVQNLR